MKNKGPLFIFLLIGAIFIANYSKGAFLTGWDNLHPEFNFGLNIFRSIFSSWQEYQGLGLAAGMGHASDLPRQLFLFVSSFILPISFLRYFYHFLMLFIGALGVYYFLKIIFFPKFEDKEKELASLIGAVFYVFNLGTLQMFYVPFEPFSHHFAFLPWIFLSVLNFLNKKDKKSLLFLFAVNIFAIPQGYVATYFLITFVLISIIFLIHFLRTKEFKPIIISYLLFFVVNAFWLFPNLYFLATKSDVTLNAKINQMSTEENFLKNKKFGNLKNTTILKGFWFDNVDIDQEGTARFQMRDWSKHLNNFFISSIGYLLFVISISGLILSLKEKNKAALFFVAIFSLSFIVLSNATPVFSQLSSLFYKIPLFSQIFRSPFTKFAIVIAFCLSIFYSFAFSYIYKKINKTIFKYSLFTLFIVLPIIFVYPVFLGKFFDSKNSLKIPYYYFQVFDFFENQNKNERIANFPQYSYWGWTFYKWGYRGSGILWYGIKQPVLDRAFDVWSKENENYYNEISYAIFANKKNLFENLLEKYQIQWILIDDNVRTYYAEKQIYFNTLKENLENSKKIKLVKRFDKISVYKVSLENNPKENIFLTQNLPFIEPKYNWSNYDKAYHQFGNYLSNLEQDNGDKISYPFRSLFLEKGQDTSNFTIKDNKEYFSFTVKIPKDYSNGSLIIPKYYGPELTEVGSNNFSRRTIKFPQFFLDKEILLTNLENGNDTLEENKENNVSQTISLSYIKEGILEVRIPKIKGYFSYSSNLKQDIINKEAKACNLFNKGNYKRQVLKDKEIVRLISIGSSNCLEFSLPNLSYDLAYILSVNSKNIEGRSLLLSVTNSKTQRVDQETYLSKNSSPVSYYIIPPMEKHGLGYQILLDNISIGKVKTVNDFEKIEINPIPYRFLTSIILVKGNPKRSGILPSNLISVEHPNPSLYNVDLNNSAIEQFNNKTIVLSQSFNKGWKAYQVKSSKLKVQSFLTELFPFFFGEEVKKHVLVNNWENGWILNNSHLSTLNSQLIIVYLPQYLEYFGFLLLFSTFFFLILKLLRDKSELA